MIRCSSLLQSKNRLSQVFCSTLPAYIKIQWFLWISSGTRSIGGLRQSYDAIKIQQSSSQLIWSVLCHRICSQRWSYNGIKIQFIIVDLVCAVSQNLQSVLVLQWDHDDLVVCTVPRPCQNKIFFFLWPILAAHFVSVSICSFG